jgi:hypothetical protein
MEIKWDDEDPATGERRWVRAERFSKEWRFTYRTARRGGAWEPGPPPTRAMWLHVLDVLERRYRLRRGVSDADVAEVKRTLARMPRDDEEE